MTPEKELLLAVLKQAIRDYMSLDPDSDTVSAEYFIDEGNDYKTAEDFLYNNVIIPYGNLNLTYEHVCTILNIDGKKIRRRMAKHVVEY